MNGNQNKSEQGQAIVYLVLGLIVFFGFVALAIDGGMALADRRNSQNAADAASLAGGGEAASILDLAAPQCYADWTCNGGGFGNGQYAEAKSSQAAKNRADLNGFNIDYNMADHNGVNVNCVDVGGTTGKYIDVTVDISATTQSNFLQLVFPSVLHNEVTSVTRVFPKQPIGLDDAVIGLNPAACIGGNGVTVNGTAGTIVNGGNVFSNGCIQGNGTKGNIKVEGGGIFGHYISEGNITWDPAPQPTEELIQPSDYYIDPPTCTTWYTTLPAGPLSGLYCMTKNLDLKPGDTGYGVTFYVPNGTISANGNEKNAITLYSPSLDPLDPGYSANTNGIYGILFFVPNGGAVTINGSSLDRYYGMVYAPNSQVSMTGTADNIFWGQVIGWDVKIGGTNNMQVNYDDCKGYTRPPFIRLNK